MPVFVDVEPDRYCIAPEQIERHITPRTRAIMPVHIAGLPCEMDPVLEIGQRHDLRIVEDSAESMFVRYRGRPVGSMSDIGCFSTYVAHIITTGVGGFCVTDDDELIVMLKSLMNHGRDSIYTRIDDDKGREGQALFDIADRRFSFVRLGYSYRCTEMEAALGLAQLDSREADWERRKVIAQRLCAGLAPLAGRLQLPVERDGAEHAWMFFPLVLQDDTVTRATLIQFLEEHQIETRYMLPLLNQPVYKKLFGDLESVMPHNVRLVAVRPQTDPKNNIQLEMTVGAQSVEPVVDMLKKMEGSGIFSVPSVANCLPPSQSEPLYRCRVSVNYAQKL